MPDHNEIEFVSHHVPPMTSGAYKVSVTQTVSEKPAGPVVASFTSKDLEFNVQGARFQLEASDVTAVFPPNGSLGDHQNVLPHVVLNRSTLPWERQATTGHTTAPAPSWLALVILSEDDVKPLPAPQTTTVGEQLRANTDDNYWIGLKKEAGQHDDDKMTVIDLPLKQLKNIMPTTEDLALLAHVRVTKNVKGDIQETAVVMANRLPTAGRLNRAYLVSVEGRYTINKKAKGSFKFPSSAASTVRFVLLKSWRFSCSAHKHSFTGLLNALDASRNLGLPATGNSVADTLLADARVPLPHQLRDGSRNYGWYRGPLVPSATLPNVPLSVDPPVAADALLRFDVDTRMFDVSYAAAFELGRLLTLADQRISTELLQWKQRRRQQQLAKSQAQLHKHLALKSASNKKAEALPSACVQWLQDLMHLKPLPFNYLLPDERLLPTESLRFFELDLLWVKRLWQGVLSLGPNVDDMYSGLDPSDTISGFFLRSDLVSGWPGLEIDGWDKRTAKRDVDTPMTLIRREQPSANVLICLFQSKPGQGVLKAVDLHLKPETLHMGLTEPSGKGKPWTKKHRDADGIETGNSLPLTPRADLWRHHRSDTPVLNIRKLAELIGAVDDNQKVQSAQFALQMTEGVPIKRFRRR